MICPDKIAQLSAPLAAIKENFAAFNKLTFDAMMEELQDANPANDFTAVDFTEKTKYARIAMHKGLHELLLAVDLLGVSNHDAS